MMEFTLARISSCICGALIVAILFNPVVASYDGRAASENWDNCETVGKMLDAFMDSEAEESTADLGILLPDSNTRISFEGNRMTMENDRGTWSYNLRYETDTDGPYVFSDFLKLSKNGAVLTIRCA